MDGISVSSFALLSPRFITVLYLNSKAVDGWSGMVFNGRGSVMDVGVCNPV